MAASAWLQQEIMPVDINFERRDLTSAQKSHPSPDDLVETFCIYSNKTKYTLFFYLFNTKLFTVSLKNVYLNYYYCQVLLFASYQRWLIRQRLLISASPPRLCLFPSLICSPTRQPNSKVDNSRMHRYRNAVFTSNFFFISMLVCS